MSLTFERSFFGFGFASGAGVSTVVSLGVGFSNRQSFYAAFYRIMGETPNSYRKKHLSKKQ